MDVRGNWQRASHVLCSSVRARIAVVECPFVPALAAWKETEQIGIPAGIGRHDLRYVAFARPRFSVQASLSKCATMLTSSPPRTRIMHDMAMRPHRIGCRRRVDAARNGAGRSHAAPADAAGKARYVAAEQAVAHDGMNAVGANDDVGLERAAVGKARDRQRSHIAAVTSTAMQRAPKRSAVVLRARRKTSIRSARCTVRFGAPNFRRKSPGRMREISRPLFQLRMFKNSEPDPMAWIWSSMPSARNALTAFGVRFNPAPISLGADDCSHTMTSAPRRSNASAAASPPMPPPMMATRGGREVEGNGIDKM